jgi:hypothetical protein
MDYFLIHLMEQNSNKIFWYERIELNWKTIVKFMNRIQVNFKEPTKYMNWI